MTQDGENPDEYVFECGTTATGAATTNANANANASPKKRAGVQNNGPADGGDEGTATTANDAKAGKIDIGADEVNEDVVEEQSAEPTENDPDQDQDQYQEQDQDQDQIQLTMADSEKLDSNTLDNEDSLNLTIGEDEAKIFQDEVSARIYTSVWPSAN